MFCENLFPMAPVLVFVIIGAVSFTLAVTKILQLEGIVRQLRSAEPPGQDAQG